MEGVERFSLLLLEAGEIYFEDYAAIYLLPKEVPAALNTWEAKFESGTIRGRLKVCSKSLVFDPRDSRAPIIKFPYRGIEVIEETISSHANDLMFNGEEVVRVVEARSNLTVEMLERGVLQPYRFCREVRTHQFQLIYAEVSAVLPQVSQLHRASTLPPNDQNTMVQAIVRSRQQRKRFDRALLTDLSEKEVYEGLASKVTPLVTNPGTVLVTDAVLYFQSHNNAEKHPVIRINLGEIRQVIKRRYLLRQVGLEVFCREHCMVKHLLLVFKKCEERDLVYEVLVTQPGVSLDLQAQDNMTFQWQAGAVSNYDYLCYLNSQADRSENDLTQYPVFPWVVADYTSADLDLSDPAVYRDLTKPVGALNEERLSRLKERCKDMPEPRFLYGSHYSTPGFVLYYLVRQHPQYMLCLQNGRFDHPDRMFNSLKETWENVTANPSDFKELIPQFYNPDTTPEFLINASNIDFGVRQNGKPVGDVELPPWAKGDPSRVVRMLRDALESEVVSASLHHWIDLVFGYKQRGEEAEKADNVFYHLCYEGSVDLGAVTDLNDRLALEVQITEFGQVPKQLFSRPHPARCSTPHLPLHCGPVLGGQASPVGDEEAEASIGAGAVPGDVWQCLGSLQVVGECRVHREAVMGLSFTCDTTKIMSVGRDALAKLLSLPSLEQVRSVRVGSMAVSCCQHVPDTKTVLVGSWDNNVYRYSLEYGQVSLLLRAHSDAISCLQWRDGTLVTGSLDCTARVWSLEVSASSESAMAAVSAGQNILGEMDHDSPVLSLALHPSGTLLATGTEEGQVALWELPHGECRHLVHCHEGRVWAVAWSAAASGVAAVSGVSGVGTEDRVLSAGQDGRLVILEADGGKRVCVHHLHQPVRCVVWDGQRLVVCGMTSGDLLVFDMGAGKVIFKLSAHQGAISSLALTSDLRYLATGGEDRRVKLWGVTSE
ncbi:protein FAN-like isoform X3 [Scylla paramamosain]|uniref:protein FAN-like isoform X3 n=1 Tax=Scylla paramamosain TaxID=85552 RepID=UPI0030827BFB